jgi:hypothetical protein
MESRKEGVRTPFKNRLLSQLRRLTRPNGYRANLGVSNTIQEKLFECPTDLPPILILDQQKLPLGHGDAVRFAGHMHIKGSLAFFHEAGEYLSG